MAEKQWNGRSYRYDRLPADQSLRLLARLLKVFGPAATILGAIGEQDESKRDAAFMVALPEFLAKMDDTAVVDLILEVVKMARVEGKPAIPGVMELDELIQTAFFVLSTEYSSFLGGSAGSFLSPR